MTIWVLKEYFSTIPVDIEEMAMIDGATRFQAFRLGGAADRRPGPDGSRG